MRAAIAVFAMMTGLASAPTLRAQTCPDPSPAACTAHAAPGQAFSGPVLQVIDGQTLCVALGPQPSQWVRVRITDADRDVPRGALMAAAFAKNVTCLATGAADDGVRAACFANGVSVGAASGAPVDRAQAADWR